MSQTPTKGEKLVEKIESLMDTKSVWTRCWDKEGRLGYQADLDEDWRVYLNRVWWNNEVEMVVTIAVELLGEEGRGFIYEDNGITVPTLEDLWHLVVEMDLEWDKEIKSTFNSWLDTPMIQEAKSAL